MSHAQKLTNKGKPTLGGEDFDCQQHLPVQHLALHDAWEVSLPKTWRASWAHLDAIHRLFFHSALLSFGRKISIIHPKLA